MHYKNDKGNDIFVIFRGTEYGDDAQISMKTSLTLRILSDATDSRNIRQISCG